MLKTSIFMTGTGGGRMYVLEQIKAGSFIWKTNHKIFNFDNTQVK